MAERGFIDVYSYFGPDHGTGSLADVPLSLLIEQRRRHGIRLSLAHSALALRADPWRGNRLAAEAAADPANGLAAIAAVAARQTGGAARRVAEAEAAGVVGYLLEDLSAPLAEATRELLIAVARSGRPLLVPLAWHGAGGGQASFIGAATADLGIPVILLGAHYNHIVDDLSAAVRYPHLYLETSSLAHFRAIETTVRTIGAERLLLGTGSPRRPAGSAIAAVLLARVADDAKRQILGANAARLFGLPATAIDVAPPELPARSFDVHTHYGPFDLDVPPVAEASLRSVLLNGPAGGGVASSAPAIFGDPVHGNAQAVTAATGDGQWSYVVVDASDFELSADQLRRHLGRSGVLGVKVHGEISDVPTASRRMRELFALLARYGRPVKIHNAGDGWADALLELARAWPRLPIIVAHAGLGAPSADAGRLAASAERIYFELSSSFTELAEVRRAIAAAPRERILWGSDAPLLDPAYVLGTYSDAGLPPRAGDDVYWHNAVDLFGMAGDA